jgi:hypothetical protein
VRRAGRQQSAVGEAAQLRSCDRGKARPGQPGDQAMGPAGMAEEGSEAFCRQQPAPRLPTTSGELGAAASPAVPSSPAPAPAHLGLSRRHSNSGSSRKRAAPRGRVWEAGEEEGDAPPAIDLTQDDSEQAGAAALPRKLQRKGEVIELLDD